MQRPLQGRYVTISTVGETAQAFVPAPLPPDPPICWAPDLRAKFDQALLGLGQLDGVATLLPDIDLFIYTYVRKEAVLSSMIEGTQSSLADLLLFEMAQELLALTQQDQDKIATLGRAAHSVYQVHHVMMGCSIITW